MTGAAPGSEPRCAKGLLPSECPITGAGDPVPGAILDQQLGTLIRRTRIAQIGMTAAVAVALILSLGTAVYVAAAAAARSQLAASCAFYRDLGTSQPAGKPSPSRLGIQVVADARNAFRGIGCPGKLPAPTPALLKYAAKYGIKVRY